MDTIISGKIIAVLPVKSGTSAKGTEWRAQTAVLETQEKYPKRIALDILNDDITKFNVHVGDSVDVKIDIDAREYNGKWFNSIKCWSLYHNMSGAGEASATQVQPQQAAAQPQPASQPTQTDGSLPF